MRFKKEPIEFTIDKDPLNKEEIDHKIKRLKLKNWIYKMLGITYENIINDLTIIHPNDCEAALELCEKYLELDDYRKRVVALGRTMVAGEYKMMKEWDQKAGSRQEEISAQNAFERLHTPDTLFNRALWGSNKS